MPLQPVFGEHTINELSLMFGKRQINLEPGFQRHSVWTLPDRQRLMQSPCVRVVVACFYHRSSEIFRTQGRHDDQSLFLSV